MNNGNPIEKMHANETSLGPDLKRRRLVRGAIGIAPVVLTLRSGALAAAVSCTGVLQLTTVDEEGVIANTTGISEGNICVTGHDTSECPTDIREISKIRTGVVIDGGVVNGNKCSIARSQAVAILSTAAASSLIIPTTGV